MKSFLKNSFLKKLTITYITILILPIMVMSVSIFCQFDNVLKKELITNNANTLDRTGYILDKNMSNLYTIKDNIIQGSVLSSPDNLSNPEKVLSIQREFQKYIASNFFINEICVYFHNEDYIYTSKSSYQISTFINTAYQFSDWSETDFVNDINQISHPFIKTSPTIYPDSGLTDDMIIFLFPVTENSVPKATLMFFVENSYIENIMQSNTKENISKIIILDKNNDAVISTLKNYTDNKKKIENFVTSGKETDEIKLDSVKYQITSADSELTNMKYVMLTPMSHVLMKKQNILINSVFILSFLLLLGILIITYSLKVTYNPIKTLKEFSSNIANINSPSDDEIESIKSVINHLSAENINIIEKTAPMTQDYILENLIKGRYTSTEELNEYIKPFNISFKNHIYAVLIIKVYAGASNRNEIKAVMNNFFYGLIKEEHPSNEKYIAVITPDVNDPDILLQTVSEFQEILKDELSISTTIGVSNIYDEIQKISLCYIQACSAMDYRLIKGNGSIIPYSSILPIIEGHEHTYPDNNLENLHFFIKNGDIDSINDTLDTTLDFIKENDVPLFITRILCFDMINTIWKSFTELQKSIALPTNEYPNITILSKYDTVDDLIQILKNFCTNLCGEINSSSHKKDEELINSILQFIQENFKSSSFSIQIMAEHFDMSLTNISQYFKTRTNQTIIDYITNLRISAAKQKLLTTEMSVNEIAAHVGYLNSSSFIRRFKQITGLTPKQFVNENKKIEK